MQEYGTKLVRYKGVLAAKGCREKFIFQGVHMSFSGCFASDAMSGADAARGTWEDGEGRECRFVSIGKEMTQNAENLKRDFLLCVAEENLRFKVGEQLQARVGGGKKDGWMVDMNHKRAQPTAGKKGHSQQQARMSTANGRRKGPEGQSAHSRGGADISWQSAHILPTHSSRLSNARDTTRQHKHSTELASCWLIILPG